ncbi:AI-2 transport protein TqsA [Oxobacter pfennigii]|uniref:AI-2 transport protein TqsA n=1 Tax=Oxobacter pfennigii TaxID=36849 RepID=A0A0P8YYS9_9CLOT|nr:AI-2E family transporter [Oxobacter pfennigii]KPU44956.1 AI-2 transport protein TqsA [Oxobacter pfennigii]
MKLHIAKVTIYKTLTIIILIFLLGFIIIFSRYIYDILYIFILSFFIAYLLNPLICYFEHRGMKRSAAIIIIYIALVAIFVFICLYALPELFKDLGKLSQVAPEYYDEFNSFISEIQNIYLKAGLPEGIKNVIDNSIKKYQFYFTMYLENATSSIITVASNIFKYSLVPILMYYFLKDFNSIAEKSRLLVPRKYRQSTVRIFESVDNILGSYVRSQMILSLLIAIMTSIALFFLKVEFFLIIGILNGVTNIIPYFGPIIGTVPAVLFAFLDTPIKALYTLIAMIIIQQLEADIIAPKIMGNSVGLHPVTVILMLLIGGKFFGVAGLILAVPAAAALKTIYKDIMKNMF